MTEHRDLVFDIGMADGSDTAHYLLQGYRVVAVEANPDAASACQRRFHAETEAGRLSILNIGIADTPGSFTFWRNVNRPKQSSFDRKMAATSGEVEPVQIQCTTFGEILGEYGVPHYLKIDIEGADRSCIDTLRRDSSPTYLSVEAFTGNFPLLLRSLVGLGYTRFKLINQQTHTTNTEIRTAETALRALRWATRRCPPFGWAVRNLPNALKPPKTEFERRCHPVSDSGPFGEQTWGYWITPEATLSKGQTIVENEPGAWYDLHCAR
jgi:FkbM family methyltransferase